MPTTLVFDLHEEVHKLIAAAVQPTDHSAIANLGWKVVIASKSDSGRWEVHSEISQSQVEGLLLAVGGVLSWGGALKVVTPSSSRTGQ